MKNKLPLILSMAALAVLGGGLASCGSGNGSSAASTPAVASSSAPAQKSVQSISVATTGGLQDAKVEYNIGEPFVANGLVITVTYSDGSTERINPNKATYTGFDSSKAGKCTVTVTYGGKSATFEVTILAPAQEKEALFSWNCDDAAKKLDFYNDGSYHFAYTVASMGVTLEEEGTWTWQNWSLKVVTPAGNEQSGSVDAETHDLLLTYTADAGDGRVVANFTCPSSVWGQALGGSGSYTPVVIDGGEGEGEGEGEGQGENVLFAATVAIGEKEVTVSFLNDGTYAIAGAMSVSGTWKVEEGALVVDNATYDAETKKLHFSLYSGQAQFDVELDDDALLALGLIDALYEAGISIGDKDVNVLFLSNGTYKIYGAMSVSGTWKVEEGALVVENATYDAETKTLHFSLYGGKAAFDVELNDDALVALGVIEIVLEGKATVGDKELFVSFLGNGTYNISGAMSVSGTWKVEEGALVVENATYDAANKSLHFTLYGGRAEFDLVLGDAGLVGLGVINVLFDVKVSVSGREIVVTFMDNGAFAISGAMSVSGNWRVVEGELMVDYAEYIAETKQLHFSLYSGQAQFDVTLTDAQARLLGL